ncbi:MAG: hypothetical protein SXG53_09450 [Pseudomonadota bacterium]|nr:hypothetical protein [Pseudomonadota bacterium]
MRRATSARLFQRQRIWAVAALLVLFHCMPASAITVNRLVYDADQDKLVMVINYRGTNEDHEFSVQWNECTRLDDERSQILGLLIDSQADDHARQEFEQDFEIDMAGFGCRPAKVTIRTSAGFFMSVDVPPPLRKNRPSATNREARNAAPSE